MFDRSLFLSLILLFAATLGSPAALACPTCQGGKEPGGVASTQTGGMTADSGQEEKCDPASPGYLLCLAKYAAEIKAAQ